ncbi:MAG: hypothetical protein COC01_02610 [Bacteroidetes bacterium]|nr:MAG: hypothetical protein COC01_02610 [Bacteroidota bacterium]
MTLTEEQIDIVDQGIYKSGVTMQSLRHDLLDHISCSIEDKMEDGMDFRESFIETFRAFGLGGLRRVQKNTEYTVANRRSFWHYVAISLDYSINVMYLLGSIAYTLLPFVFAYFAGDIKVAIICSPFTLTGLYILRYGIDYKKFALRYLY